MMHAEKGIEEASGQVEVKFSMGVLVAAGCSRRKRAKE